MSRVVSGRLFDADKWLAALSRFYHCFDYWPGQNGLRDLAGLFSLVCFQAFLALFCWIASGWVIVWRLSE
ncbi:hypothetical protein [uncultured Cohaesibacter sp.]|uniref:hypothetical protein n=1 Tax=uncultured Cohaesibacter sp. TaxID=1002546 RepID=UPI0029C782A2|nr:hypothetical protein [uncultured Cohaesibacter sp.]